MCVLQSTFHDDESGALGQERLRLIAKRLERGTFIIPKTRADGVIELEAAELALVLEGIDPGPPCAPCRASRGQRSNGQSQRSL
ncbi:MAG: transposase [Myxococcales bacterium]|nr:transposase [Myxococcales bacterium]